MKIEHRCYHLNLYKLFVWFHEILLQRNNDCGYISITPTFFFFVTNNKIRKGKGVFQKENGFHSRARNGIDGNMIIEMCANRSIVEWIEELVPMQIMLQKRMPMGINEPSVESLKSCQKLLS